MAPQNIIKLYTMVRANLFLSTGLLSLCLFFLLQHKIYSQNEGDSFVYGQCNSTYEFLPCSPPVANSILQFTEDSIFSTPCVNSNGTFMYANSSFTNNQVQYFSNGRILSNTFEIIDSNLIDVYDLNVLGSTWASGGFQSPLFLNIKNQNQERVFLFYNYNDVAYDTVFAYAELAAVPVPKEEVFISKKNVLLSNVDTTTIGGISACRHANGRDWWVMKSGIYHDEFYQGLLDPSGIVMEKMWTNVPHYKHLGLTTSSFFNLTGTKFYHFTYGGFYNANGPLDERNLIYIYDFDRCNGQLSNPVVHDITQHTIFVHDNYLGCLSPDGSKFYFTKSYEVNAQDQPTGDGGIYQYDFETSTFVKVKNLPVGYPILSPYGDKIVIITAAPSNIPPLYFQPSLDIIYNPNAAGLACNYQDNQVSLTSVGVHYPPTIANFRLGPVDGSICDSLGLDAPMQIAKAPKLNALKIYPNPTNGTVKIDLNNENKHAIAFYNSLGQRIQQIETTQKTLELDLKHWGLATGFYFVEIIDLESKRRFNSKLVYQYN